MKRLAIYYFYDKQGIVDDYIITLIKEMKKCIEYLVVIVEDYIDNEGKEKLIEFANKLVVLRNCDTNLKAYHFGISEFQWENLKQFDEIVLFDNSLFGPFNSINVVFDEMELCKVDYWGLVNEYVDDEYVQGNTLRYINLNFIVLRRSLILNKNFQEFFKNIKLDYQMKFIINKFQRLNVIGKAYIDTSDLEKLCNRPFIYYAKELIENRNCPFLSKYSLYYDENEHPDMGCGEEGLELYNYLNSKKKYNTDLIWDNLLRTVNMYDIKHCMQWNFILPTSTQNSLSSKKYKVALFLHIYYVDLIDYCRKYAESMPENADIYITTCDKKNIEFIEKSFKNLKLNKIIIIENRGRDISSLLVGLRPYVNEYDFICFAHDKKSFQSEPYIIGESFSYGCFENILSSKSYVENIILTFEKNSRLGLLTPPPPCHGPYYQIISQEWQSNYKNTKNLAKCLGLEVDISENKPPIAPFGTMFWFRRSSLNILFNHMFCYTDFPLEPTGNNDGNIMHAIERIYPYVVQQQGYFVGWVMSDTYSKMFITNLNKYAQDVNYAVLHIGDIVTCKQMIEKIKNNKYVYFKLLPLTWKIKILIRRVIGKENYYKLVKLKNVIIKKTKWRVTK